METTKKLNETPLIQQMTDKHTYIIVDDQGNVSRVKDVAKEYVTETELNDFIKPYDDRITTNETNISDLETNIGSTKTDVLDLESYMDIVTPKNTASGEIAYTTDALPLPTFGTKSGGNVEQETTKGNQLFDISTVRNVGITPDTGATWANSVWRLSDYIKIEENTPFTFSWVSNHQYFQVQGCYYDENKTYISGFNMTTDGVYSRTETTPSGTKYLRIAYSIDVNGNVVTREDIMLNLGTTALPWEKFTNGASPNPEYPQEIEVLEGYNEFNYDNFATKIGVVTGSSDNFTIAGAINTEYSLNLKGQYTFSGKWSTTFGNGHIKLFYTDGSSQNLFTLYTSGTGNGSFKLTSDVNKTISHLQIVMYNSKCDFAIEEMLIVKGTIQKPYLPYGCVGYKVTGKNLLSVDMFIDNTIPSINTGQNVSGAGNTATSYIEIDNSLPLIYSTSQTGKGKYAFYYDENYNYLGCKANSAEAYLEISKDDYYKNAKYIRLRLDGLTKETVKKAQLEYNSTATPYEPYKEQIVYLDLKGNWVGKISDTIKDYLVTDKKKYWLVKNIGKVVLDGRENWETWGVNNTTEGITGFYSYDTNDFIQGTYWLSNYFIYNTNAWGGGEIGICASGKGTKYVYISVKNELLNDVSTNEKAIASFKTWLKEQYNNGTPVIAYYQLAEPQIIELGELPEPIKTFEGVNNIQLLANLDTEIEVVYAQDVKKYIDSKLAEISAQII